MKWSKMKMFHKTDVAYTNIHAWSQQPSVTWLLNWFLNKYMMNEILESRSRHQHDTVVEVMSHAPWKSKYKMLRKWATRREKRNLIPVGLKCQRLRTYKKDFPRSKNHMYVKFNPPTRVEWDLFGMWCERVTDDYVFVAMDEEWRLLGYSCASLMNLFRAQPKILGKVSAG